MPSAVPSPVHVEAPQVAPAAGVAPRPAAVSLAVAAARHGLPGARPVEVDVAGGWTSAVGALEAQRLVGAARVLVADGGADPTPEGADALAEAHARLVHRDLALERELLVSLEEWEVDAVHARVLKGVAVAHLDEVDPSLRSFGDVDLLVRAADVDAVVGRAVALGAVRSYPEPRPGFDRRFGKGVNLVRPSGLSIDLHRSLALGPFGLAIRADDLFGSSQSFTLAGTRLRALDRVHRWLHACYHAALGSATPPLVSLRDVALTLPVDRRATEAALATAHTWRGELVVAEAVRLTVATLALDPDAHPVFRWAHAASAPARAERWLDAYRRQRSTPLQTLYAIEALDRCADRAAYAAAIAAPRQLRTTDDRSRRWRRALRATRLVAPR